MPIFGVPCHRRGCQDPRSKRTRAGGSRHREYLRLKHFSTIQVFPKPSLRTFQTCNLSTGLEIIAGILYVPLSQGGTDFIVLLA